MRKQRTDGDVYLKTNFTFITKVYLHFRKINILKKMVVSQRLQGSMQIQWVLYLCLNIIPHK